MNYTSEEVAKALEMIQDICNDVKDCYKCPFGLDDICMLQDRPPIEWKINSPKTWKAFN